MDKLPSELFERCSRIAGPQRSGAVLYFGRVSDKRPVLFFGMSRSAFGEASVVKRGNRRAGGVTAIINDEQETLTLMRSIAGESGLDAVIARWELPDNQARAVAELIKKPRPREEALLLRLAQVYAEAESGCRRMERVVFSGESLAIELFSRERGLKYASIDFESVVQLRRVFPEAAGQVRHVFVAACSCGFRRDIEQFRAMYPNVLTIAAYAGKGPSGTMARSDLAYWESHTRSAAVRTLAPLPKRTGDRGGEINMSTWSVAEGYRGELKPIERVLELVRGDEPAFKARLEGNPEPGDSPDFGVVHDYYRNLTELVGRADYTDELGRQRYSAQREQAMRLRYWTLVRKRFGEEFQDQLRRGFDCAGASIPEFSNLRRAEVVGSIRELEAAQSRLREDAVRLAQVMAALRLLRGLQSLDPKLIPRTWL